MNLLQNLMMQHLLDAETALVGFRYAVETIQVSRVLRKIANAHTDGGDEDP
jgi:hypothetical protein